MDRYWHSMYFTHYFTQVNPARPVRDIVARWEALSRNDNWRIRREAWGRAGTFCGPGS